MEIGWLCPGKGAGQAWYNFRGPSDQRPVLGSGGERQSLHCQSLQHGCHLRHNPARRLCGPAHVLHKLVMGFCLSHTCLSHTCLSHTCSDQQCFHWTMSNVSLTEYMIYSHWLRSWWDAYDAQREADQFFENKKQASKQTNEKQNRKQSVLCLVYMFV